MSPQNQYIVVLMTSPSVEEAKKITHALVSGKLIVCGNIVPGIQSIFFWQGKVAQENEVLIIGKSKRSAFPGIVEKVKSLHSYTLPEIIALPLIEGSEDYLQWIDETVQ
ncbi:MAG: divalent-cation tolerance protein CutA [Nitrospirae bacterium]|nr:divalent-cation tolerance protein CutA [Nitrospirota bacterium]